MGRALSFDNGLVSFEVNGIPDAVRFNPTDTDFFRRLYATFEDIDRLCEQYKLRVNVIDANDLKAQYNLMVDLDKDITDRIDTVFGDPGLSARIFTIDGLSISPNALAGGLPIWANFLLAVLEEREDAFKEQEKLSKSRMDKYLKKYKK